MDVPYLSNDIVNEILSRIPTPYLCRWKCVSKLWYNVLVPEILVHRRESIAFVEFGDIGQPYFFSSSNDGIHYDNSYLSVESNIEGLVLYTLDVCNGVALTWLRLRAPKGVIFVAKYALYNPLTCESSIIDPPSTSSLWAKNIGFSFLAYDPRVSSHNFNIISITRSNESFVYSSNTKEWRQLEMCNHLKKNLSSNYFTFLWKGSYCVNGIAYKMTRGLDQDADCQEKILGFDIRKKRLWLINSPARLVEIGLSHSFGESAGHLCFIRYRYQRMSLDIWVLQDCNSSNWVLCHTINFNPALQPWRDGLRFFNFHPLDTEAIFVTSLKRITYLYNFKTLECREVSTPNRIKENGILNVYLHADNFSMPPKY